MQTATETWRGLIREIMATGHYVRQNGRAHEPRDRSTKELIGHQTKWPMQAPAILCPGRKIGYRFMVAEAAWITSGDNRLSTIGPYARHMAKFSDDGMMLSGAYGPKFVDQEGYVVQALLKDSHSRQAVVSLWRERPGPSADIACTLSLQWLLRNEVLYCLATMRSSDAWLGIPYDVVSFSAMSARIAIALRMRGVDCDLGYLTITCGSQHLYAIDHELAMACAQREDICAIPTPLDLSEFDSPGHLTEHLWSLARCDGTTKHGWLRDLP